MDNVRLNDEQKEAVMHFMGPIIVVAGPGSGKTTIVIHRIKNLIDNYSVRPENILVITFTKSAATEMQTRYCEIDNNNTKKISFGTFHALFFRIIRNYYNLTINNIIKEDEKWGVLKEIVRELEIDLNDEEEYIKDFLSEYSRIKNDMIDYRYHNPFSFPKEEFIKIYSGFENFKERNNKIDFDDMLTMCYELLIHDDKVLKKWQDKFKYILVDEFQDINKIQYECLKLLAKPENNVFAVGDDDQSIYSFRGGRPEYLIEFLKEFDGAKEVKLRTNYRSTDEIIKLSSVIINNNKIRVKKDISGTGKKGVLPKFNSWDDASKEADEISKQILALKNEQNIPFEEMAIIIRTNMQTGNYARAFLNSGINYILKDTMPNIYESWVSKDILSYLNLAIDETSNKDFIRIANKPKRYISKEILSNLSAKEGSMMKNFFLLRELKQWQSRQIYELSKHLVQIRKREPYEAIKYIRQVVAYDDYLQEYATYRKANIVGLKEIADEIQDASRNLDSFEEYFAKISELSDSTKKSNKEDKKEVLNAVTISTIHSAKGLEFDTVFIPSIIENLMPHERSMNDFGIEEERRLFYVAVTRAKNNLYLSNIRNRHDKPVKQSTFLTELGINSK